jgi:hypothetical protein
MPQTEIFPIGFVSWGRQAVLDLSLESNQIAGAFPTTGTQGLCVKQAKR